MRLSINTDRPTGCESAGQDARPTTFEWSGDSATGPFGVINLRPGLDIVVGVRSAHAYPKLTFELGSVPLELAFHLSGIRRYHITFTHSRKREAIARAGQCAISYLPFCHGEIENLGDHDHFCFNIFITRHCLRAYFADHAGDIPGFLASFVNHRGSGGGPILEQFQSTAGVDAIVRQILNCPYQGALGRMYLEGKTLELLAMVFGRSDWQPGSTAVLCNAERERVQAARQYLLKDLGNPPDLGTLSRVVGMNRNKLNRGFKTLYGASVFEVLRREKLNHAIRLLDQQDLNIGQVAYAAGFKSHSHFTTAFVKAFNLSPYAYRKRLITDTCPTLACAHRARRAADNACMGKATPAFDPFQHDPQAYNLVKLAKRGRL